ncbi:DUF2637 domain-containing protein [Streptomyces sp. ISL-11]|nr:DUF2637 domain-containing protein [Streptomyces sp. ISL-11]MBT2382091.1 DUF2637 domain-containing protein [Streptomyces sp. ISL-11]
MQVAITALASQLTVVLTAVAFWLSYEHLQELAARHGMADAAARSWAWPATVDLFIVIGELLILRASLAKRVDLCAIGLATAGSGGSIALNVAAVGTNATTLDYIVAAVPPVAALLAFGALMRQVHAYLSRRTQTRPHGSSTPVNAPPTPVEEPLPPPAVTLDRAPGGQPPAEAVPTSAAPTPLPALTAFTTPSTPVNAPVDHTPAARPEPVAADPPPEPVAAPSPTGIDRPSTPVELCAPVIYPNRVDQLIRALYGTDFVQPSTARMTESMAAAGLGGSESTARTARGRVKAREPYLAALPTAIAG